MRFTAIPQASPGVDQARATVASGFAKQPTQQWRGQDVGTLPAAADPASVDPNTPPGGDRPSTETADAAQPDPLIEEFNSVTGRLALNTAESSELMALHQKSVQAYREAHDRTADAWRAETTRSIPAAELGYIQREFNARIGNDADAAEFKRLLTWSGIGNHPSAVRAIARLMRGR